MPVAVNNPDPANPGPLNPGMPDPNPRPTEVPHDLPPEGVPQPPSEMPNDLPNETPPQPPREVPGMRNLRARRRAPALPAARGIC